MAYDNICKYLAEEYPSEFFYWLLGEEPRDIQVLKTELSAEPIQADALSLLQSTNQILHLEFQTLPQSEPPLAFRMLDYWVRLQRKYRCRIEQVVIFLKSTTSDLVFTNEFRDTNTWHRYRVIRLWEQDPQPLLANRALLPLATLARSNSPNRLLEQVVAQVDKIEEKPLRGNLAACVDVLAGLRFDQDLVRRLLREEVMEESVTYQDIIQKGVQKGIQRGKQEEAVLIVMRLLTLRLGLIDPVLQQRIEGLSITRLEELSEALLDFETATDLAVWLDQC
ncbi:MULTISPECIES: Rpn family recombination-promoting nuclease/putative transposase [unclassified Moorena]|uniref:Rpn family recombination-promoting nuclease/putative transposase n=1 Tax=unclassified Moorena TaxID=2683338 RepID=UPI0013BCBC1B|nr:MULTISPECIES: Rpn family recombination-promoting nuclease/putative transposase [unclassified Moorena]NEQ05975.1 Rpn family recombination-promoting nuclease/putative transposase [Moorena sp. SIO4E2]NEQ15448.1 Rpn family recombination-promoting nuclease/putative transposase [Moorena sp. SIO3E2]NER90239.1 Rpn family recombination-promoting nuclease/putative transposase [Moorena sp. SIO3A2]NES44381.1 Rpn family recombination-promoting nuclease/putative transposase [Moorena sp. SIO2C4]